MAKFSTENLTPGKRPNF